MSVHWGKAEVVQDRAKDRFDPKPTLSAIYYFTPFER